MSSNEEWRMSICFLKPSRWVCCILQSTLWKSIYVNSKATVYLSMNMNISCIIIVTDEISHSIQDSSRNKEGSGNFIGCSQMLVTGRRRRGRSFHGFSSKIGLFCSIRKNWEEEKFQGCLVSAWLKSEIASYSEREIEFLGIYNWGSLVMGLSWMNAMLSGHNAKRGDLSLAICTSNYWCLLLQSSQTLDISPSLLGPQKVWEYKWYLL